MKVEIKYSNPSATNGKGIVLAEVEGDFMIIKPRDDAKIEGIYTCFDDMMVVLSSLPDRIDVEQYNPDKFNAVNIHIIGKLDNSIWRDEPIKLFPDSISRTVMQKGELVKV